MKKEEVGIDQLLEEQNQSAAYATVEVVPGSPSKVKVTPWIPGRGCSCSHSLIVEKKSISKLARTEHRNFCCGKLLNVVEVTFAKASTLSMSDVFADLTQRAARQMGHTRTTQRPFA